MKQYSLTQDNYNNNLQITKKKFDSDCDENKHKVIYYVINPFADINDITKKKIPHHKSFREESEIHNINILPTDDIVKNLQDELYKTSSTEIQTPTAISRINSLNMPMISSSLFKYEKKRHISPDKEYLENSNIYISKKRKIFKKESSHFTREIDLIIPESNENINFRIFNDEEIGFGAQWKEYLHDQDADEDIESADDMIDKATNYIFEKLEDGIKNIMENDYADLQNYQLK
jgi:hypothetical protein